LAFASAIAIGSARLRPSFVFRSIKLGRSLALLVRHALMNWKLDGSRLG